MGRKGQTSRASFCAKHRCRRQWPRPYAQVWPLFGRGETGGAEDAKTPLCTTWRYGFARFCQISVRSNYMCGQRWGLLQQIFISQSGKRPVATG